MNRIARMDWIQSIDNHMMTISIPVFPAALLVHVVDDGGRCSTDPLDYCPVIFAKTCGKSFQSAGVVCEGD